MIIENLSQLYPKGYLSKTIGSEATYSIPVDDQFFIVNKAFLSIKEQHLLEALFPISENPTITGNHPWFSYLFQQAKLPAEGTFRMLQIQTNVTKELQAEWQFNLTKMFPDTVDCFSPSNKDTDIQPIISALWKNQGNISSTAKDLFMHRNTLHYRLEKFFEQTGLSLKKMDDLIFCYLLLRK